MRRCCLFAVIAISMCGSAAGQLIFNEVHVFPTGNGSVRLLGDYAELWNQSPTPINLAGYQLALWNADTGAPTLKTIPSGPASTWIPGNGFYILEEGGVLGQPLCDANLASLPGMMMGVSPWASSGNIGAWIKTPQGACLDYIHLRRAATALPATPPNLPTGCSWVLGNISASGAGFDHLLRNTNTDTNSFADWSQDATINIGTPCAPNSAPAPAAQTSIGPYIPPANANYCRFGQTNSAAATLSISGTFGTAFPASSIVYSSEVIGVTINGTPNSPILLALSSACNVGHFVAGPTTFDLGAAAAGFNDVSLITPIGILPLFTGLGFPFASTNASGTLSFQVPPGGTLPKTWFQAAIIDGSPAGLSFTGATALEIRPGLGTCGPGAVIPDGQAGGGNGIPLVLQLVTPPGTTITDVNLIANLNHTWMGDVDLTLTFNGVSVILTNGTPDDDSDLTGEYRFSDQAAQTFDAAVTAATLCVPTGTYSGDNPLAVFNGMDSGAGGGIWTLTVVDTFINDIGTLNSWCIELNTSL